ncbi:hypothetical protein A9498_31115 (plasmid) [Bacillus thuringiensis serovar coreanensis]|nr:hypothetical protein A9498_31115 [Bacillus thuringiensis serovar coreanensis]
MKQRKDENKHDMIHTPHSYPIPFGSVSESAATLEDMEQVNHHISFCSIVHIPDGFVYVPNGRQKIVYNLSQLSVIQETCQRTITVENCGPVDVALNLLKVVGSIPYMVSATVQGECGQQYGDNAKSTSSIDLSYSSHILVDRVLKLSVAELPDYRIGKQNVSTSQFQVVPVQEQGSNFLRFTGTIEFQNIPLA